MSGIQLDADHIVGRVVPDDRKRVGLGRYLSREGAAEYRVYQFEGGKVLVLEAIE